MSSFDHSSIPTGRRTIPFLRHTTLSHSSTLPRTQLPPTFLPSSHYPRPPLQLHGSLSPLGRLWAQRSSPRSKTPSGTQRVLLSGAPRSLEVSSRGLEPSGALRWMSKKADGGLVFDRGPLVRGPGCPGTRRPRGTGVSGMVSTEVCLALIVHPVCRTELI